MTSGLRTVCMIVGIVLLFGMRLKSDFTTLKDFLAVIICLGFPVFLIALPVVLEFIERIRR